MNLELGTQLGDYRILSTIGVGTSGEVYEGEHVITQRRDAIKILVNGQLHIPEDEQRFLREIQVQASLHHPNIAAVYTAFATPHGLALAMELVRGEPLSTILARGRVPVRQGIHYLLEVLAGLAHAHAEGVVHRDIKPANIIVAPDGSVKVTDFGLARSLTSPRFTQFGAFAGSPGYMSPEQARGTCLADSRSDTYSAGVVLYELVTGQLPFPGENAFDVLMAHQQSAPKPPEELEPSIGAALNRVILAALEKDPDKRFQDAGAFRTALQEVTAPSLRSSPVAAYGSLWARRILMSSAASSILAMGSFYSFVRHRQPQPPVSASQHASDSAREVPSQPVSNAGAAVPAPPAAPQEANVHSATMVQSATSTQPPRKLSPRAPRPAPVPTGLRITGSSPSDPNALPHRPVPAAQATVPALAPPPVVALNPSPGPPPAIVVDQKAPPAKRRNVVVRTLQKVFGTRRDNTTAEPNL